MKVIAVIQARLGSQRLPRKILQRIDGRPILQHVIERAKQINGVDVVVVASPHADLAEIVVAVPKGGWIDFADLSVADNDVLGRFASCAEYHQADVVMRLTADCPFLDPRVCEKVLQRFFEESADYASNDTTQSGYPDGLDCEVFTRAALDRAHQEATDPYDREHVTPYMKRMVGARIVLVRNEQPGDLTKISVDTPEDLERVRAKARER